MDMLWRRYDELLKAYDELDNCKSRVQLAIKELGGFDRDAKDRSSFYEWELTSEYFSAYDNAVVTQSAFDAAVRTLSFHKENEAVASKECKEIASLNTCAICLDIMNPNDKDKRVGFISGCLHKFHVHCITEWFKQRNRCPICNRSFQSKDLKDYSNQQHKRPNAEHTVVMSIEESVSNSEQISLINEISNSRKYYLKGDFGSKVDALVTDLYELMNKPLRQYERPEKAIVFSQWIEMIELIGKSLRLNGIRYVIAKDKKKDFAVGGAIDIFKHNDDFKILLMPLNLGAEGLDLIVANHIFLLEPLINKAMEEQSVNRCHRIGQMREVKIYKYIIQGTIEERIVALSKSEQKNTTEENDSPSPKKKRLENSPKKNRKVGDQNDLSITDLKFLLNSEI